MQGDCGTRFPWIEPALREFGEKALRSAQGSGQTNEQALDVSVGSVEMVVIVVFVENAGLGVAEETEEGSGLRKALSKPTSRHCM